MHNERVSVKQRATFSPSLQAQGQRYHILPIPPTCSPTAHLDGSVDETSRTEHALFCQALFYQATAPCRHPLPAVSRLLFRRRRPHLRPSRRSRRRRCRHDSHDPAQVPRGGRGRRPLPAQSLGRRPQQARPLCLPHQTAHHPRPAAAAAASIALAPGSVAITGVGTGVGRCSELCYRLCRAEGP